MLPSEILQNLNLFLTFLQLSTSSTFVIYFPTPLDSKPFIFICLFGYFRISNLLAPSRLTFDIKKQLCRGDMLVKGNNPIVIVKWSKTLQASNQGLFIILPQLNNLLLCPFKSLRKCITPILYQKISLCSALIICPSLRLRHDHT